LIDILIEKKSLSYRIDEAELEDLLSSLKSADQREHKSFSVVRMAQLNVVNRNFNESVALLASKGTDDGRTELVRAEAYRGLGKYTESLSLIRKVLSANDAKVNPYSLRALVAALLAKGNHADARAELAKYSRGVSGKLVSVLEGRIADEVMRAEYAPLELKNWAKSRLST
jgi:tetratricopeptide (TPR) repeat protein